MRIILTLIVLSFTTQPFLAQVPLYHKVKVYADNSELMQMAKAGLCVDHGELRPDYYLINEFSEPDIAVIEKMGLRYEVLIEDMAQYYLQRNSSYKKKPKEKVYDYNEPEYEVPQNFELGSYGGFFTYDEMLANLDSMFAKYPHLITQRASAHDSLRTIEGREIYFVKISDNAELDEEEDEIFYNALHHAREPGSLSHLIFYMWYLLENYETDASIKRLVDNLEMYFIPCINVDGYLYNLEIQPYGGGLWRKNMRDNGDGTQGVDLNRNYGFSWGYDDIGSSPYSGSLVYRGTEEFSEPELQIVKAFCEAHNFKIAFNCHTVGNLLIYPWGFDYGLFTPDSAQYVNYAELFTQYNDYTYGTGDQTVNYIVNGDSDDWMYGDTISKNKIFAFTPESGNPEWGFYSPRDEIIPICKDNMWQNLSAAKMILNYIKVEDENELYVSENTGYLEFSLKRLGMQSGSYGVSIQSPNGNLETDEVVSSTELDLLEEKLDSISYTLADDLAPGDNIEIEFVVDYGDATESFYFEKVYLPEPIVAFEDGFENIDNWEGDWGLSGEDEAIPGIFTDSPNTPLDQLSYKLLSTQTLNYIDLRGAEAAILQFRTIWDIEARYDYARVFVETKKDPDTKISLLGKHTGPGNGAQLEDQPIYDGFKVGWVLEEMNLNQFLGEEIKIGFEMVYDDRSSKDGIYIDDLKVIKHGESPAVNNIAPIANNDIDTIRTYDLINIDVLANDEDSEDDVLSLAEIITSPALGTASIEGNTISYQVNASFSYNNDTLVYLVCDTLNACDTASLFLYLDVISNIPPVANDDIDTIKTNDFVFIDVLANDQYGKGEALTLTIFINPNLGTVTFEDNVIKYIVNGYLPYNNDTLAYVVCDTANLCDTANVFLYLDVVSSVIENDASVKIYPNPAKSFIYFEGLAANSSINFYNASGKLIQQAGSNKTTQKIDLTNFEKGLHFGTIQQGEKQLTLKFLVMD